MEVNRFGGVVAAAAALVLIVSGCSAGGGSESPNGSSGAGSGTSTTDGAGDDSLDGGAESLDPAALIEGGMAGDFGITCDYDNSDGLAGTIFIHGAEKQRLDGVNAMGAPSHILLFEGQAHAWNDADSEGARYPKADGVNWLADDDPAELLAHSSNCVPLPDESVFELPEGITFISITDVTNG